MLHQACRYPGRSPWELLKPKVTLSRGLVHRALPRPTRPTHSRVQSVRRRASLLVKGGSLADAGVRQKNSIVKDGSPLAECPPRGHALTFIFLLSSIRSNPDSWRFYCLPSERWRCESEAVSRSSKKNNDNGISFSVKWNLDGVRVLGFVRLNTQNLKFGNPTSALDGPVDSKPSGSRRPDAVTGGPVLARVGVH